MKWVYILVTFLFYSCRSHTFDSNNFPEYLTHFAGIPGPVFSGNPDTNAWDHHIRERGYILLEDSIYHLWYTGYHHDGDSMKLGYATSRDGIHWRRCSDRPLFDSVWTEDMMVIKDGNTYQMFAEGRNDVAHRLVSTDKIHWTEQGSLRIISQNADSWIPGPYGTPSVIKENNTWYLFYERNDSAIWLASSQDLQTFKNVQDEPVIKKGPDPYDAHGLAANQIVKIDGTYYCYYHGTPDADWSTWNTNVAKSQDKIHWIKYRGNPILKENKSSGILLFDGDRYRLYSMHASVHLHYSMPVLH